MKLPEKLLHFIWRYKCFRQSDLYTLDGDRLRIVDFGQYNHDAGPDFEYAKIYINDVLWIGNVEIHVTEKDWLAHRHDSDPKYDNTILHVVWEESNTDFHIIRSDQTNIPTLQLKSLVPTLFLEKYQQLSENLNWIPCENQIGDLENIVIYNTLDRFVVERLESKSSYFLSYLERVNGDWEKLLWIALGRAFGMKVNSSVFEDFVARLNLNLLRKYADDPLKIEAICFGIAGFLHENFEDVYFQKVQKEYQYLKYVHAFQELKSFEWKFLRMRPANFPTIRLAQFVAMIQYSTQWFGLLMKAEEMTTVVAAFNTIKYNDYWSTHYRFNQVATSHSYTISSDFANHIFINAFIPVLFLYGNFTQHTKYVNKALLWLQELPSESNSIIRSFKKIGVSSNSASDSQALLYLKNSYCDQKKCLQCGIGLAILKTT